MTRLVVLLLAAGLFGCIEDQPVGSSGSTPQANNSAKAQDQNPEASAQSPSASSPFSRLQTSAITPIKKLLSARDPAVAASQTVYLRGRVSLQAPLLQGQAYQLQDATGTIWVVSASTELSSGDEVLIKGVVQYESIPLAGQEWGELYIQEEEQLERLAARPSDPASRS